MGSVVKWLKESLIVSGLSVLAVVCVLLLLLLARPLMVVVLAASLVFVPLWIFSPRVRRWLEAPEQGS